MASLLPSSIHKFPNISHRGARRLGRVEERITPWTAEAPQRVTALVHRVTTLFSTLWDVQIEKREEGPNILNQTDVYVPNNKDVVINVTQTDAGVSATTSLLSQAPLNGQTTGCFDIENPRSLSPADQDVVINVNGAVRDQPIPISAQATTSFNIESSRSLTPFEVVSNDNAHEVRDQTVVDMSDTAPLLPLTPISDMHAQATSSSQIQNSRNLPREEVVINVNGAVRDQTDVRVNHTSPVGADRAIIAFNIESSRNLSEFEVNLLSDNENPIRLLDTTSLLPQTLIVAQAATTNSHRQNPRSLPREGGQNSSGVANAGSGMPSQHSRQPSSPIEGHNNDIIQAVITHAKDVLNRLMVGSLGLASVAAVNSGKVTADHLQDNSFFTAFVSLGFALLPLACGLYRLININHPESIPGFVRIVKFTSNLSQLVLVYTACCGFCILFQSVVLKVVIMTAPLISMGFVAILEWICS